jgi:hypothetical protein
MPPLFWVEQLGRERLRVEKEPHVVVGEVIAKAIARKPRGAAPAHT